MTDADTTELEECMVCGALGLPERIENHDCDDFRNHQQERGW